MDRQIILLCLDGETAAEIGEVRSLEKQRDGYVAVQRFVLLVVPGVVASGWGGARQSKRRHWGLGRYRFTIAI